MLSTILCADKVPACLLEAAGELIPGLPSPRLDCEAVHCDTLDCCCDSLFASSLLCAGAKIQLLAQVVPVMRVLKGTRPHCVASAHPAGGLRGHSPAAAAG